MATACAHSDEEIRHEDALNLSCGKAGVLSRLRSLEREASAGMRKAQGSRD